MKKIILLLAMGSALTTQALFAQVPSYVPTNGLVGYWPFNGNANDESGHSFNGTTINTTLSTDRFGLNNSCYYFNGNNAYIDLPTNAGQISGATSFSISAWIETEVINSSIPQAIFTNWHMSTSPVGVPIGFYFTIYNNKIYSNYTSGQGIGSNSNITQNQWHNIIIVYDGSQSVNSNREKLYIDGAEVQLDFSCLNCNVTIPNSIGLLGTYSRIGARPNEFFKGKIDDICIWNRVISSDEIIGIYNNENTCQTLVINTGILSFNPPTYQNTVTIYPNPANDQITIDCGNLANVSGWSIKISNILGQEVFNSPMNTQQYVVPLNSWTGQGVYFVRIYDASNNLVNTKKIILQ